MMLSIRYLTTLSIIGMAIVMFSLSAYLMFVLREDDLSDNAKYKSAGTMALVGRIRVWGVLYFVALCFTLISHPESSVGISLIYRRIAFSLHLIVVPAITLGYIKYISLTEYRIFRGIMIFRDITVSSLEK